MSPFSFFKAHAPLFFLFLYEKSTLAWSHYHWFRKVKLVSSFLLCCFCFIHRLTSQAFPIHSQPWSTGWPPISTRNKFSRFCPIYSKPNIEGMFGKNDSWRKGILIYSWNQDICNLVFRKVIYQWWMFVFFLKKWGSFFFFFTD